MSSEQRASGATTSSDARTDTDAGTGYTVLGVTVPGTALVALVPAAGWWMANVGFYALGFLDTHEVGYRAWQSGVTGFPQWFQLAFGYASPPSWGLGLVVLGAAASTSGWAVLRPLVVGLAILSVVAIVLAVAGTAVWPDAA